MFQKLTITIISLILLCGNEFQLILGASLSRKNNINNNNNVPVLTYDDSMLDQVYENDDYNYDDYYKDPELNSYYYYDENSMIVGPGQQPPNAGDDAAPFVKVPSSFNNIPNLANSVKSYEKANLEKQTMTLSENISSFSDNVKFRFNVLYRQMGKRRARTNKKHKYFLTTLF